MLFSLLKPAAPAAPSDTAASPADTTIPPPTQIPSAAVAAPPPRDRSLFSRRSIGQLGLFFAGATFVALSTSMTRRAITRRQIEAQLKFFQQSGGTVSKEGGAAGPVADATCAASALGDPEPASHGSSVAVEALSLATLNVVSFFVMLGGGLAWALDISSPDDLQRLSQRQLLNKLTGHSDPEADEKAERELSEFMERMMGSTPEPSSDAQDKPADHK